MKQPNISPANLPSLSRTIPLLLLVLFAIEILLMYLIPLLVPDRLPWLRNLADAGLLTLLFAPLLYRFIWKPHRDVASLQMSLTDEILAHLVDGVVLADRSGTIVSFNQAAGTIFGYRPDEMTGAPLSTILGSALEGEISLPEGDRDGERAAVRELTGSRKDGSAVPVELSLSPFRLGRAWLWLAVVRDVTTRKESREQMEQTLSLLRGTLESTGDGIMVRDLEGRPVIYNRRFTELWRIPPEVMATGNDPLIRSHVKAQVKDPDAFMSLTNHQYEAIGQESRDLIQFQDGRVMERFSAPQVIGEEIVGRVICYRDITEQNALEQQLRHAQKMEALGTLAGGMAHDFNNILTVVMGFARLIAMDLPKEHPLRHPVDQIMNASERALALTGSLLAYSRKQPMTPLPMRLNDRLRITQKFLARLIGEHIELITRFSTEELTVMADGNQLDQVLMNLAANARDAMGGKGCLVIGTRRLEIGEDFVRLHGYGKAGSFALLSVSDTGAGMDEATREKIFEPFFTTKPSGQGTGLGLSIVYGIVKQHQGYITVYSEPGQGTTFNIYLPLVDFVPVADAVERREAPGGSETILVAEDDPGVRTLLRSVLTGAGYRVFEAENGAEAVERFREHREEIDLLILDVVMPGKNGREALEEIRKVAPGTGALFISGYTADIVDRNGLVESGTELVMKPLLPDQLLATVRERLDTPHPKG
ncbi:hypothetical protein GMSM_27030 [Geomonas sp. Red276]